MEMDRKYQTLGISISVITVSENDALTPLTCSDNDIAVYCRAFPSFSALQLISFHFLQGL